MTLTFSNNGETAIQNDTYGKSHINFDTNYNKLYAKN